MKLIEKLMAIYCIPFFIILAPREAWEMFKIWKKGVEKVTK